MINKEHITNITDKVLKNTPIALISTEDGKIALPIIGAYGFSGDTLNAMWEHVGAGANLPVNSPVVAFKKGGITYVLPILADTGEVQVPDPSDSVITFTANTAGSTISFAKLAVQDGVSNTMYKTPDMSDWETCTSATKVTLANVGDTVKFAMHTHEIAHDGTTVYTNFKMTGSIACSGELRTHGYRCYAKLFMGCTALTSAPALPSMDLYETCYWNMFNGCKNLKDAPQLPATTMAYASYYCMFQNCTGLINAPALPALSVSTSGYFNMFYGCTSLTKAPHLPAKSIIASSYKQMFYGCKNLTEISCDLESWYSGGTDNWLYGVPATGTFKCSSKLPVTRGASNIPEGWDIVHTD